MGGSTNTFIIKHAFLAFILEIITKIYFKILKGTLPVTKNLLGEF
jgi:hypothetical protein